MSDRARAIVLRWRAGRRRRQGRYDRATLQLMRQARLTGDANALLDYLLFRRDLGYTVQPRHVPALLAHHRRLTARRQWQAAALLCEAGYDQARALWSDIAPGIGITDVAPMQPSWRNRFCSALQDARPRGIFVVGNAGTLAGSRLGEQIDAAGMVIRFNRFSTEASDKADIGTVTSAWVVAPGYQSAQPPQVDWVVVSGPDVCFHTRDWSARAERVAAAQPLLTVPLPVWRRLVNVLQAPPSAGVVMLAWLHDLLGDWQDITCAGIGSGVQKPYHHAHTRWRPASRHAWHCESALVRDWADQGLRVLPRPPHAAGPAAP